MEYILVCIFMMLRKVFFFHLIAFLTVLSHRINFRSLNISWCMFVKISRTPTASFFESTSPSKDNVPLPVGVVTETYLSNICKCWYGKIRFGAKVTYTPPQHYIFFRSSNEKEGDIYWVFVYSAVFSLIRKWGPDSPPPSFAPSLRNRNGSRYFGGKLWGNDWIWLIRKDRVIASAYHTCRYINGTPDLLLREGFDISDR